MDIIVVWLFNVRGKEFAEPIILLTSFVLSLVVFTLTANHRQSSYIKYASCQDPHHIFPLSFPNLLDVILCPFSFDISSSPMQVRRLLKVRDGELSGNWWKWIMHSRKEYVLTYLYNHLFCGKCHFSLSFFLPLRVPYFVRLLIVPTFCAIYFSL